MANLTRNKQLAPDRQLDLEEGLDKLQSSLIAISALLGAARSIDCTAHHLGCLIDLTAEKAGHVRELSGFGAMQP
jgi:hypothetical protein